MAGKENNGFPRGIEVVVGIVIENKKSEILLTKSPKWGNKWVLPGGHVEPGETIASAAVREGKEETGLAMKPVGIFNWGEMVNSAEFHRPSHLIHFDVYCRSAPGKVRLEKRELTEWKWVMPDEALGFSLAEGYADSLRKFMEYKRKVMS